MKIRIIQTITNTLSEERELLKSVTYEAFRIAPESGKALKNIEDGKIYTSTITVSPESELKKYVEVDYILEDEDF